MKQFWLSSGRISLPGTHSQKRKYSCVDSVRCLNTTFTLRSISQLATVSSVEQVLIGGSDSYTRTL